MMTTCNSLFFFCFEGEDFEHPEPKITGAELFEATQTPVEVGLIRILKDGTQELVEPCDVFALAPRPNFRRKPKFRRGMHS